MMRIITTVIEAAKKKPLNNLCRITEFRKTGKRMLIFLKCEYTLSIPFDFIGIDRLCCTVFEIWGFPTTSVVTKVNQPLPKSNIRYIAYIYYAFHRIDYTATILVSQQQFTYAGFTVPVYLHRLHSLSLTTTCAVASEGAARKRKIAARKGEDRLAAQAIERKRDAGQAAAERRDRYIWRRRRI